MCTDRPSSRKKTTPLSPSSPVTKAIKIEPGTSSSSSFHASSSSKSSVKVKTEPLAISEPQVNFFTQTYNDDKMKKYKISAFDTTSAKRLFFNEVCEIGSTNGKRPLLTFQPPLGDCFSYKYRISSSLY